MILNDGSSWLLMVFIRGPLMKRVMMMVNLCFNHGEFVMTM